MTTGREIVVVEKSVRYAHFGRHPTIESVELDKVVVGAAIVHHVHRVLTLREAQRLVREERDGKLGGNFFQAIVHRHEFEENSQRRIHRLADALGVDPGYEVAKAYQNPDAFIARCKSFRIDLPSFVRARLERRAPDLWATNVCQVGGAVAA